MDTRRGPGWPARSGIAVAIPAVAGAAVAIAADTAVRR